MEALIQEKLKRKNKDSVENGEAKKVKKDSSEKKTNVEFNMLVKNSKRNALIFKEK